MRVPAGRWLSVPLIAGALVACPPPPTGELAFAVDEGGRRPLVDGTYTFPATWAGGRSTPVTLLLENHGGAPLTIVSTTLVGGPGLGFALPTPVTVPPRGAEPTTIFFAPPYAAVFDASFAFDLVFLLDDGRTRTLTLLGTALAHDCSLPAELDFGAIPLNGGATRDLVLRNDMDQETYATLGAPQPAVPDVFRWPFTGPEAWPRMQPRSSTTVPFTFSPAAAQDYAATVSAQRAEACPGQTIRLVGTGVSSCLSWRAAPTDDPATASRVDFGFVAPGSTAQGEVVFFNACSDAVRLSDFQLSEPQFAVVDVPGGALVVPGAVRIPTGGWTPGAGRVGVTFSPNGVGTRFGTLRATTNLSAQAAITLVVRGVGGNGPRLELQPSALNFGETAYFPGATPPSAAELTLTLRNTGSPVSSATPLRLGTTSPARPPFAVSAGANTSVDELCVGEFDDATRTCRGTIAGQPATSLSLQPGARAELPIRVTPRSTGPKRWTLTFASNDRAQPVQTLQVQAAVTTPPACTYASSRELAFGTLTPPKRVTLPVTLRNTGSAPCTFSGFRFTGDLAPQLRLDLGPDGGTTLALAPGERSQLPITVTPQDTLDGGLLVGQLAFNATSPTAPLGRVDLSAQPVDDCLNLTMDDVDFGAVPLGCASAERTFRVYNRCDQSALLTDAGFTANEPGGDGGVAFEWINGGGLLGAIGPYDSRSFTVRFRPPGPGLHQGAFTLTGLQAGRATATVGALRGTGHATGEQEDVFVQPSGHRADVLLLIDASGSLSEEMAGLMRTRTAFLDYAIQSNADFHLGVTTLDDDPTGERGRLRQTPSADRYLTRTTQSLAAQFDALVQVGSAGSGTEMALSVAVKALTPPLTLQSSPNVGFLRDDAVLGVAVLTDELEQSPQPNAHYVDQLLDLKGPRRQNQFSYSVFGPFVQGPGISDTDGPPNGRHTLAVAAMNGLRENVFDVGAVPAIATGPVSRIGAQAFGHRERILLTSRPAPGVTPAVSIDGATVPSGGPAWTYDAVANAIVFGPAYAPAPGSTVRVRYATACLP